MTVDRALGWAAELLRLAGVDSSRLDAELMLAEVLGVPRYKLITEQARVLGRREEKDFRALVMRRGDREPLHYILGRREFWSKEFPVDRRVLIPRPETELVVEAALDEARRREGDFLLIDMGCGCGNMSIVLAGEMPSARVLAVDISRVAALCTREAAVIHGVDDRIGVICADMFSAFGDDVRADMIVSNPPYIETADIATLQPEVSRFEPVRALDGGPDGLAVIRRLIAAAAGHLIKEGTLIFESGSDQEMSIRETVAGDMSWESHTVRNDYSGHPRVHILRRR